MWKCVIFPFQQAGILLPWVETGNNRSFYRYVANQRSPICFTSPVQEAKIAAVAAKYSLRRIIVRRFSQPDQIHA